jgi:nitrate reductase gamma subunit
MSDWTTEAVDTVERVVGVVRDKAVEPAQRATRAVVFGLLTSFFIFAALLLVSIAAFRALDVYLPGEVWSAYLVTGGIFVIAGMLLWTRRSARPQPGPGDPRGGTA